MTPGPCDLATNSRDIDTDASGASLRILIRQTMNLPYIRLVFNHISCGLRYARTESSVISRYILRLFINYHWWAVGR